MVYQKNCQCLCNGKFYTDEWYINHKKSKTHQDWEKAELKQWIEEEEAAYWQQLVAEQAEIHQADSDSDSDSDSDEQVETHLEDSDSDSDSEDE